MQAVIRKKFKINQDIQDERNTGTFNTEELINLLDGGVESTQRRRRNESICTNDPTLGVNFDPFALNYEDLYNKSVKLSAELVKKFYTGSFPKSDDPDAALVEVSKLLSYSVVNPNASPFYLHLAFYYTFISQASDSLFNKWAPLINNFKIIGAYAQTELGHGTNIRNLETTATYDERSEEFVLHSPTYTSIKFWPGSIAKTCNYAIVMAQLYTKGKCYGIHTFMVQIRDLKDHSPLPGVTVGSMGPKMGMNSIDNGYLILKKVRIPREHMMMKHAQVLRDGTYVKPENPYAAYATMMILRLGIILSSSQLLANSCVIAIRYSAIRRQGKILSKNPEVKILDYQVQQFRLFPCVAMSYAFHFTYEMMKPYFENAVKNPTLDVIAELHALSSGIKALSTRLATTGVEQCRLACGGMGYLQASRLPSLYNDITPSCTYEGDNYVLHLQTARFLMKSAKTVIYGEGDLSDSVKFLTNIVISQPNNPLQELVNKFQNTSKKLIFKVAEKLEQEIILEKALELAWQEHSVELIDCSMMFCMSYILTTWNSYIEKTPMSISLKTVQKELFEFLSLYWMYENSGVFLINNTISLEEMNTVIDRLKVLMKKLRCNIVPLVDAFDFHDEKLFSLIGCYDGQVYERIYEYITNIPANKEKVPEVYKTYLQPMLKSQL